MKSAKPETSTELMTAPAEAMPIQSAQPGTILDVLLKAAYDPTLDVNKMERLMTMYQSEVTRLAEGEFNRAMQSVQRAMPPIVRDSTNPSTNSKYVKLEKIQEVLNPLLLENNFTLTYGTDKSELADHYGVTALLTHNADDKRIGCFSRNYRLDVPADVLGAKGNPNKTKTHGFGSSLSYGERYLVKLIFNLRLIGEDDDGNLGGKPKPPGPSTKQGEDSATRQLAKALWSLLPKEVTEGQPNWSKPKQWLLDNDFLSPDEHGGNERAPALSPERYGEIIEKVKAKAGAK